MDIGKVSYNIEINEENINKYKEEIKTIQRGNRKRKKHYEDLSLRLSELKNSIKVHKIDILVLRDKIIKSE